MSVLEDKVYPRENALEGETIVLAPLHVCSWAEDPRDPSKGLSLAWVGKGGMCWMPSDHSNPEHRPGRGALKVPAGMGYTSDNANSQQLPSTECPLWRS